MATIRIYIEPYTDSSSYTLHYLKSQQYWRWTNIMEIQIDAILCEFSREVQEDKCKPNIMIPHVIFVFIFFFTIIYCLLVLWISSDLRVHLW